MTDIVDRLKWWAAKRRPPQNMPTLPADCAEAVDTITALRSRIATLGKALGPFKPVANAILAEAPAGTNHYSLALDNPDSSFRVRAGDFFAVRSALSEDGGGE